MNRITKIFLTGLIALTMILGSAGMVWATVTINATTVSGDGALTLTGATASTWSTTAGAVTIQSGDGAINLTAVTDVVVPANVGITFAGTEKIESDGTDLTFTVGATGDINIGADIGLTFGDDGEKIEGDGTDLTITGNNINLTSTTAVAVTGNLTISNSTTLGDGMTDAITLNGQITSDTISSSAETVHYVINSVTATSGTHNNVRIRGQSTATGASTSDLRGLYAQGVTNAALFGGTTTAIYANAIAKGTSTTVTLRGILIDTETEDTPTALTNMYGLYIRNKSTITVSGDNYSLVIDNEKMGGGIVQDAGIQLKTTTWGADVTAWTYGIDMNQTGAFGTADIRLSNAATIDNTSDGTLTITEPIIALAGDVTVTGNIDVTEAELASGAYNSAVKSVSTIIDGGTSEGIAGYFEGHVDASSSHSGNLLYAVGAWLNVDNGATVTGGALRALDVGIYAIGASSTLTGTQIYPMNIGVHVDASDDAAEIYQIRFNTTQSGANPDYMWRATNPEAVAFTAGAGTYTTADGYVLVRINATTYRMPLYLAVD